jgi:hypothetical protein
MPSGVKAYRPHLGPVYVAHKTEMPNEIFTVLGRVHAVGLSRRRVLRRRPFHRGLPRPAHVGRRRRVRQRQRGCLCREGTGQLLHTRANKQAFTRTRNKNGLARVGLAFNNKNDSRSAPLRELPR